MTTHPAMFYYAVIAGLLSYLLKKYLAHQGWSIRQFVSAELTGVINSIWVTAALAYLLPDAVVAASEMEDMAQFAAKHAGLVEKITVVCGGLLGFTGGSIAIDLMPMLYNLPIIGPLLKSIIGKISGTKAEPAGE